MADPLFGHPMRDERKMIHVIRAWDPAPPQPFLGAQQPLAPRKNPPGLLSVDRPPGGPWELAVALNEDYYTPYLLAQRYANRKIIVSVDNPPDIEPEKTPTSQSVPRSWDPPPPQPFLGGLQPLAPRKSPPSLLSVDNPPLAEGGKTVAFQSILKSWDPQVFYQPQTRYRLLAGQQFAAGAINSVGVATTTWIGAFTQVFTPKPAFQAHITRAWEQPVTITISLPQQSIGSTSSSASWNAIGSGTAAWIGSSLQPFLPKAAFQKHIVRSWELPQIVTISLPQVTFGQGATSGSLSSVGTGTATWKGASSQPAVPKLTQPHIVRTWESPKFYPEYPLERAKLPPQLLGEPAASGPPGYIWELLELAPEDTTAYVRAQPRYKLIPIPSVRGNLSSLGVGLARWIGKKSASAVFFGQGQGVARFVGTSTGGRTVNLDGWRPRRELLERRRLKDEQEIMAILAAVLPIVQSGTVRSPTRISVPRNGRTTLQ